MMERKTISWHGPRQLLFACKDIQEILEQTHSSLGDSLRYISRDEEGKPLFHSEIQIRQTQEDAEKFFYQKKFTKTITPPENFNQLLENSFCVGENHSDQAPKKFLIENMRLLKEVGYEILFLEHLLYNSTLQDSLDFYFESPPKADMPQDLQNYLEWLDKGFDIKYGSNFCI